MQGVLNANRNREFHCRWLLCGAAAIAICSPAYGQSVAPAGGAVPGALAANQDTSQPQAGGTRADSTNQAPPPASAATVAPPTTPEAAANSQEIVVTGFRRSLLNATRAKENSVNFTDSIFAEDVGKFPDTNLAESLQRVPGVQLTRDTITGEGVQVAIRALPPSFTIVTVDGNRIQLASFGAEENPSTGRETDLDLFPSELFARIDVNKTPSADQPEGGIAGTVNMSNVRPFDNHGHGFIEGSISGRYGTLSKKISPRASLIASKTWGNFGILAGVVLQESKNRTDGWESIGWSNANLACAGCDNSAGNNFVFANVVPANAGNGLTPGTPLDAAALAALNPKITLNQLTNALIPRLGRPMFYLEDRKRGTGLVSLEWRPSDNLRFALDGTYGKSIRFINRYDMDWIVRNTSPAFGGGMVPINLQVDANNVVTSGTFANSNFFVEDRTFDEHMTYVSVSPSMSWNITKNLKFDAQLSGNDSHYMLIRPSVNIRTAFNQGITVQYQNSPGSDFPTITSSFDLTNPNQSWALNNIQLSEVRRTTETRSAHGNLTWDVGNIQFKAGGSFDRLSRSIVAYDNSAAWLAAYNAAVPDASIPKYLMPNGLSDYLSTLNGSTNFNDFVIANLPALKAATNFYQLAANAPLATPATAAVTPGAIREEYLAGYGMVSGDLDLGGHDLRFNAGGRYVRTNQHVEGPVLINGNLLTLTSDRSYDNFLPSANAVFKVRRNVTLRLAASETISRPNPNDLLPGISIIDPSVQTANAGNPNLQPFKSTNVDFGGEWYTGGLGYVGLALFWKRMTNFTYPTQVQKRFSDLGIPVSSLNSVQQAAIAASGGPDKQIVFVNTQTNSPNPLEFRGAEITWVQPLDFVVRGLGFSAVLTEIETVGKTNLATGVPKTSANFTAYYETGPVSIRASYAYASRRSFLPAPQNGLPLGIYLEPRGQVDLAASYTLPRGIKLTLDVVNLLDAPIKQTFGFTNATESIFSSGTQVTFGVQAKF